MVYAVYRPTGDLYDVTVSQDEAELTRARIAGSFVRRFDKLEEVPKFSVPADAGTENWKN